MGEGTFVGTMRGPDGWRPRVQGSGELQRLVGAHLLAVITEWASVIAVLVYAFEHSGAKATGLASLALLAPQLVGAPLAAALAGQWPPRRLRAAGLAVQATGFGVAAWLAAVDGSVVAVVAATVVGLVALGTLRPTGAVLLPGAVRTTAELTRGNLWMSQAEGLSALAGPLLAAGLLAIGGPAGALAGCALLVAVAAGLSVVGVDARAVPEAHEATWRPGPVLAGAVHTMRSRPRTIAILSVVAARSAVVGFLDVALVVLAFEELELGPSAPGLLGGLVGAGALTSAATAAVLVRRGRLAPWLAVGLAASAALCLLLGAVPVLPVAVLVLPVLGLLSALLYGLGTILLQRSADPRVLGSLFAFVELVGGVGLLIGSGLAQVLIALSGVPAALGGLAASLVLVLALVGRAVWRADADADVPVVEMTVLHELSMFSPLPPIELEAVARVAEAVDVAEDEVVIRQGDLGDRFYAVVDGAFDITMDGVPIRVARRGSCFGEVALLASVPRTATVTALEAGSLLAIDRAPFLVAMTGRDAALAAAWSFVQEMPVASALPDAPMLALDATDETDGELGSSRASGSGPDPI